MDRLNSDFNRLSTSAREWTPNQVPPRGTTGTGSSLDQSGSTSNVESDLNAKVVKEFVPGRGWSAASSSGLQQQASDAGVSGQGTKMTLLN